MKRIAFALIFTLLCGFFLGCGSNGDRDTITNIRFLNAVPDARSVDLFIDFKPEVERVSYLENTGYFEVDAKSTQLQVTETSSFANLVDIQTSLQDDQDYTLIACGTVERPSSMLLRDDNDPGDSETTKIRIINTGRETGSVDVYVASPALSIEGIAPTEDSLGFRGVSQYFLSAPGNYRISVTNKNSKEIIASLPAQEFRGERIYTVVIADPQNSQTAPRLIVLTDRD